MRTNPLTYRPNVRVNQVQCPACDGGTTSEDMLDSRGEHTTREVRCDRCDGNAALDIDELREHEARKCLDNIGYAAEIIRRASIGEWIDADRGIPARLLDLAQAASDKFFANQEVTSVAIAAE